MFTIRSVYELMLQEEQSEMRQASSSPVGSLKNPIMYVGIAWVTYFIRTFLAPADIYLSAQLVNRLANLCFIDFKEFLFILPYLVCKIRLKGADLEGQLDSKASITKDYHEKR
jgi:hypothetical protein